MEIHKSPVSKALLMTQECKKETKGKKGKRKRKKVF